MKSNGGVIYKEVVIIGNGPSGIALSYMLSGNLPFITSNSHPDEMLSARLGPVVGECLIQQDFEHLAAGLEGRSTNPVSLLLDSLLHPCADLGLELPPLAEFKNVGFEIDHVVLGKGPPGGSWHKMDPYILTLSLGAWMALPGLPFHCRDSGEKRAFASNVAKYYLEYVNEMKLAKHFTSNVAVTSVAPFVTDKEVMQRLIERLDIYTPPKKCLLSDAFNYILSHSHRKLKTGRCCKRPREELCQGPNPDRKTRDITTNTQTRPQPKRNKNYHCDRSNCDTYDNYAKVPFRIRQNPFEEEEAHKNWMVECADVESGEVTTYSCKYLVLANGASDLPNKLELAAEKEDPEWLLHDLRGLETQLDAVSRNTTLDPVLIVGAGLSAADAVIATRGRNVPVLHVFRNKSADLNKQLPENMYPEYHKVHQMMKDGGSSYPLYTAYPEYTLSNIDESSHTVTLSSNSGENIKVQVSFIAVLIGSRPNLNFLPTDFTLGVKRTMPIDCKTNPLDIDKMTHRIGGFNNLYAIGPLAGDNFVRFIPGGALAVVSDLYKRM